MTEHTKTPWRVSPDWCDIESFHTDDNTVQFGICQLYADESSRANAEFIVKACNNHDALVRALERLIKDFTIHAPAAEQTCRFQAEQTLAQIK